MSQEINSIIMIPKDLFHANCTYYNYRFKLFHHLIDGRNLTNP